MRGNYVSKDWSTSALFCHHVSCGWGTPPRQRTKIKTILLKNISWSTSPEMRQLFKSKMYDAQLSQLFNFHGQMLRNKDEVTNVEIILHCPSITQTKSKCLDWMVRRELVQSSSSWTESTSMKHCLHHKHYQDCLHDDHDHEIEIDVIIIIFQEILWFDKSKMVPVGLPVPL